MREIDNEGVVGRNAVRNWAGEPSAKAARLILSGPGPVTILQKVACLKACKLVSLLLGPLVSIWRSILGKHHHHHM